MVSFIKRKMLQLKEYETEDVKLNETKKWTNVTH